MKAMFVCTGNICRSAMAEGMLKKIAIDKKLDLQVYSCGIYADNGDNATYNAIYVARDYDIDISRHRATNIRDSRIEEMDVVLCATKSHKDSVIYMYPNLKGKVYTIKEYAELDNNGKDMDIKDPWGYDVEIYNNCILQIEKCLEEIISKGKFS
ncbi:MAG: low molecular weight protein arginine phosphatase [Clostridia bacterium]|nr:low molecular weight protein arginine phosphatase [Clostridia bacterium]